MSSSKAVTVLFKQVEQSALSGQISKIDLVNEGDTLVKRFVFKKLWRGVSKFICYWKQRISLIKGFAKGFIDMHSYSDKGKIYRCNGVKRNKSRPSREYVL